MSKPWTKRTLEVDYDLANVVSILRYTESPRTYNARKVPTNVIGEILYCGRFNSVLGPEGFAVFKDRLRDVLKRVNDDAFGQNYINLDKMFESLLASGVYYIEEFLPEELRFLQTDKRWLTAYRYIASNFPQLSYQDFREIVRRFQETSGHSIYVSRRRFNVSSRSAIKTWSFSRST